MILGNARRRIADEADVARFDIGKPADEIHHLALGIGIERVDGQVPPLGIGLLVALPAVVAFNYFRGRIKRTMANADALSHVVLAYAKAEETPSKPAAIAAAGNSSLTAAERAKESEAPREKSA